MNEWREVPEDLAKPEREVFQGVTITVALSPYNFPTAVRGTYDKTLDRFVIEFRYMNDEEWTVDGVDQPVSFRVGKSSKRLCGVQVDVKKLRAREVKLNLKLLLDNELKKRLQELQGRDGLKMNYKLVEDLLSRSEGKQLLEAVPAS